METIETGTGGPAAPKAKAAASTAETQAGHMAASASASLWHDNDDGATRMQAVVTNQSTPLGADGRPYHLPLGVMEDFCVMAPDGSGIQKRRRANFEAQEGQEGPGHPYEHSPASSMMAYSPTSRALQRFTFEAEGAAAAGQYYYGSPRNAPVPVAMGGVITPGGATALMAAPIGTPGAAAITSTPMIGISCLTTESVGTSFTSTSGLTMTYANGQIRLADGTLLLATLEDRTAVDIHTDCTDRSSWLPPPLLPEHIRLVREGVEVFCATVTENIIEVVEVDGPNEAKNKDQPEKNVTCSRTTAIGQVGLRCVHCRHLVDQSQTTPNAIFYPTSLSDVYNCVMDMELRHFTRCPHFPARERLVQLLLEEKQMMDNGKDEEKEEQRKESVKAFFGEAALRLGLANNRKGWGIRHAYSVEGAAPQEVTPTSAFTVEEESAAKAAAAAAIAASNEKEGSPSRLTRREIRNTQWQATVRLSAHAKNIETVSKTATTSARVSPLPSPRGCAPTSSGSKASVQLLAPTSARSECYKGENMMLAEAPKYPSIVNFPCERKRKTHSPDEMKACVMCGHLRPMASNKNKGGRHAGSAPSRRNNNEAVIPAQNKGICTKCDVYVWVHSSTGLQIKWCKGCKNFRLWALFGEKGYASKCLKCRSSQNAAYARQKEGKADDRANSRIRTTRKAENERGGSGASCLALTSRR